MNILYGIQTTGNGHLSRSKEVVFYLKQMGHKVHVLFSGQKKKTIQDADIFKPYTVLRGLTFCTEKGKIKILKTAASLNFFKFYKDIFQFSENGFDLVITDFEPVSARVARRNKIPSIGLGHQYAFDYDIPMVKNNLLNKFIMNNFAPADVKLGLHSYHFNQPIMPPIIPDFDLSLVDETEKKIIVYLPFEDNSQVELFLRPFSEFKFYVYGTVDKEEQYDHVYFKPFSRTGFLRDLMTCNGIISNAGFELCSEALYLGKKILLKPLHGQFEQLSNAKAVQDLEYGSIMQTLDNEILDNWLHKTKENHCLRIHYPNVAKELARWIDTGQKESIEDLSKRLWEETEYIF